MANRKVDDSWTVEELREEAAAQDIEGRSAMNKQELLSALGANDSSDNDSDDRTQAEIDAEEGETPPDDVAPSAANNYRGDGTPPPWNPAKLNSDLDADDPRRSVKDYSDWGEPAQEGELGSGGPTTEKHEDPAAAFDGDPVAARLAEYARQGNFNLPEDFGYAVAARFGIDANGDAV